MSYRADQINLKNIWGPALSAVLAKPTAQKANMTHTHLIQAFIYTMRESTACSLANINKKFQCI